MKIVLSIAGSDSSGGAGIQADLKTFEAFGVFGTSAITVLTAQNTQGVETIHPVPGQFVNAQIQAILKDFDVAAIKIGMLYSQEIIENIKETISNCDIPIVFDPVFISKAGSSLLQKEAIDAMKSLFKYATVITPNTFEANELFGYRYDDADSLEALQKLDVPVLVKNISMQTPNGKVSTDQLFFKDQHRIFESEFIHTNNLHGTGCSFSSAIAANLALGLPLEDAIAVSKRFITQALHFAPAIGNGPGPINHKKGGEHVS